LCFFLPGPGERKMKVLLPLAVLLACCLFVAHGKHPRVLAPGLEGSTVGNLTAKRCPSGASFGMGQGFPSHHRCCQLRADCYASLARASGCRPRPIHPLSAFKITAPICRSGTRCQRGACICDRKTRLCQLRQRVMVRRGFKH
ncbi:PA2B1 phospholipase, partial [Turnix velox]|nr:PA2B1 phospholipase [Turnix velox]